MKPQTKGIALLFLLAPLFAHAGVTQLRAPNDTEGHIVLTSEACKLPEASKIASLYVHEGESLQRAYSVAYEGTKNEQRFEACYAIGALGPDNVPEAGAETIGVIIRIVNIFVVDAGVVHIFAHQLNEFQPYADSTL